MDVSTLNLPTYHVRKRLMHGQCRSRKMMPKIPWEKTAKQAFLKHQARRMHRQNCPDRHLNSSSHYLDLGTAMFTVPGAGTVVQVDWTLVLWAGPRPLSQEAFHDKLEFGMLLLHHHHSWGYEFVGTMGIGSLLYFETLSSFCLAKILFHQMLNHHHIHHEMSM